MASTFSMTLEPSSIAKAIEGLEKYRNSIPSRQKVCMDEVAYEGAAQMRDFFKSYEPYDFALGDTLNSIAGEIVRNEGTRVNAEVTAGGHADKVEFGFGTIAEGSYVGTAQPPNGYTDSDTGNFYFKGNENKSRGMHHTEGRYARPFMWNTAEWLHAGIPYIFEMKWAAND